MSSTLSSLPFFRNYRSRRVSSYDRTGGNRDWYDIAPGERRVIADIAGPGCIRHVWCTMLPPDDSYYRRVVIRFGEPILPADLQALAPDDRKARLAAATRLIMTRIAALTGAESREAELERLRRQAVPG